MWGRDQAGGQAGGRTVGILEMGGELAGLGAAGSLVRDIPAPHRGPLTGHGGCSPGPGPVQSWQSPSNPHRWGRRGPASPAGQAT